MPLEGIVVPSMSQMYARLRLRHLRQNLRRWRQHADTKQQRRPPARVQSRGRRFGRTACGAHGADEHTEFESHKQRMVSRLVAPAPA
jgi:hypothetical protein